MYQPSQKTTAEGFICASFCRRSSLSCALGLGVQCKRVIVFSLGSWLLSHSFRNWHSATNCFEKTQIFVSLVSMSFPLDLCHWFRNEVQVWQIRKGSMSQSELHNNEVWPLCEVLDVFFHPCTSHF